MSNCSNSISVIIPNYNRAKLIAATLENMLNQSHVPSEIIVVDDGSTDDSVAVIRSFGDRIQLIEQPTNQGPGAARNRGLEASSGNYIQFMDSDDLASLNKLEIQLAALQQSVADFAYCPWVRAKIEEETICFSGPVMQGAALPNWKPMLEWQLGSWCLVFQNCLFRREILQKAGQYRTDLMTSEDGEYLVRILLNRAVPVYTASCVVFYRIDGEGQNQITAAGTRDRHRAKDKGRYLEIVAEHLSEHLSSLHPSTKQEIALDIYRHNRFCQRMNWQTIDPNSPFTQLLKSMPPGYIRAFDGWERLTRKLSAQPATTPRSQGLALRPVGEREKCLAKQAGLKVKEQRALV